LLDFGGEVSFLVNASQVRVVVLGGLVVTVLVILPKLSIYLLPTTFIHFIKCIKVVGSKYILSSYAQHGMKGIKIFT
jgi:hypothetical protein